MFRSLNNFQTLSDCRKDLVMCSENNLFYNSASNQRHNSSKLPNANTPHSLHSNTSVRQHQQYRILEENNESSNMPKCIVRYNTDQQSSLFGEFFNHITTRKSCMDGIFYKSNRQIPHTFNRKTSLKRKCRRTIFITEQIIALEEVFKKKPYIHLEERIELMNKLNINEKSIKVWFQNRRRSSDEKQKDCNLDSLLTENSAGTIPEKLALIESYVEQNSDENGYVTLDNEMMGTLVHILDEYLPRDISLEKNPMESVTYVNKIIYEPISPVSSSENSETQDESITFDNQDLLLGISVYYYL